jgi:hypothetical protein
MEGPQASSVRHLQALYGVVVAIALTIAVEGLVPSDLDDRAKLLLTSALLVTLVPFYHGTLRHLDAVYIESREPTSRPAALLIDFFVLFGQSCLFIGLAASTGHAFGFGWAYLALLLMDIAWALITSTVFATSRASWAQLRWLKVNIVTSIVLIMLLASAELASISSDLTAAAIAGIAILRTIADYAVSWQFYASPETVALAPER